MFDLDKAIKQWRHQMLAAGIRSPVPLEELESHLHEEIEQQMKLGRSEAEAFNSAVKKIGQARMVQSEFKKVEETRKARNAKLAEIVILIATSLHSLIAVCFFLFKFQGISELTSGQQISGLAASATLALLVWGGRLSHKMISVIRARQFRNAIYISSGVLITLWALVCFQIILPHHDFPMGQLFVTILWGLFLPTGAGIGFELGNRHRRAEQVATLVS
ncbi:permease prefix domain 1-containing protein [Pedosphaera parvula]|uniref:Uncharacterized protein n=1 Tax=Pedosphaera parvula (strain Ellin514) TaxID=320771 RepID=B9XRS5_PEDPL|nr:permease prefix domain 1-containing protein [Pedosphaera parvula]EEF57436.1 hypothetical protein Cflav_PD0547 [Pedosphaera parvula Ellin514]